MGKFLHSTCLPCVRYMLLVATGLILSIFTTVPRAYGAQDSDALVQEVRKEESPRVTITVRNGSLEQVLLQLKQKTNYYILYNSQAARGVKGVSITMKDASVDAILTRSLQGSGFEYSINNGTIVIKARKAQTPPQAKEAEQRDVLEGRVVEKVNKYPLAGVSVYVKGGTFGTITDSKGQYRLEFERKPNQVIVYSFVGMDSREVAYVGQTTQDVALAEQAQTVQNVVVTGYAPIKKESFTGNSVSISKDDLLKVSKTNVIKAIQSFDPSFRMVENNSWGSDPNALPEVYIRGESGIGTKELDRDQYSKANLEGNPNLPVFILDGFEIRAQKLYDMDPNRIENITILKDAAATALYGSRAANGVVVITSIVPSPGKINVSYNMVGSVLTPDLSDYDLLNAAEKLDLEVRAGCYDPSRTSRDAILLREEYNAKLANVLKGVNTDWMSKPLRSVFNHKHSIYIDGGSEAIRFGVDLQYDKQNGVMKGSKRDRVGAGFYLQYSYKNLTIRNYATFLQTSSKESPYGSFANYTSAQPYDEYLDENGNYLQDLRQWYRGNPNRENPLYEAGLHNFDKSRTQEFVDNLSLNWNITPYLLVKGQLSITKTLSDRDNFLDPLSRRNSIIQDLTNVSSGTLSTSRSSGLIFDMSAFISYNRSFSNHNINLQGGVNLLDNSSRDLSSVYFGFPSGALNSVNYAQRMLNKPISTESTARTAGFFAGANYSYNNIYLLDLSCRFDGNSAFGRDKRFAPFWSGGVGLNIHNYSFMKEIPFISQLRLRATYGHIGKINFPAYAARTSYTILSDEWYKTGFGASLRAMGNPSLTWETTRVLDAGFELGLWNDRIYTKFSYYNKLTVDLVSDVTIPSSTGFTTYRANVGKIRNRGVEVDLRVTALRTQHMQLIFNANLAHNKNRIMEVAASLKEYNRRVQEMISNGNVTTDEFMSRPFMQYVEGISNNSIWGMKSQGIDPATGEEVFVTPDGKLTDKWAVGQQQVLGETDPTVQGSFGVNFVWKQFSVYATFMYQAGGQRYNQTLADRVEGVRIYSSNVDRRVLTDRWEKPGQHALYKKMEPGRGSVELTQPTSRFVQTYNALDLSSITIGYDFKRSVIAPLRLSMLRLELGANDLFHASSVKQERGLNYPFARTFVFSVRAAF